MAASTTLYGMGSNNFSELGTPGVVFAMDRVEVVGSRNIQVVGVSMGVRHSVAVTGEGGGG